MQFTKANETIKDSWEMDYDDAEYEDYAPKIMHMSVPKIVTLQSEKSTKIIEKVVPVDEELNKVKSRLTWVQKDEIVVKSTVVNPTEEDHDFPVLGQEKIEKKKQAIAEYQEKMLKPKQEPKQEQKQDKQEFPVPRDPRELREISLHKTRLCDSVETGKPCRHGAKCNFAHTLSELKINDCMFGTRCYFVCIGSSGNLVNSPGKKMCLYKHPDETSVNYFARVGYNTKPKILPQTQVKVSREIFSQPAKPHENSWVKPLAIRQEKVVPQIVSPLPEKVPIPTNLISEKVVTPNSPEKITDETVILYVPKECVSQAMEVALKAGTKQIRIVIV